MLPLIESTAWVIDDASVPTYGRMSVAVASGIRRTAG
jgi:SRSO17 transposase